ncbi:MAG: ATP-binding protein [Spirosomataceae bacterium]
MKINIVTLLLVIVCNTGFAQKSESVNIDSLKKELRRETIDSLRANLIFKIVYSLGDNALKAMNEGEFAVAYEAYRTIFDNLEDPENQRLFESFGESSAHNKSFWQSLTNNTFNYGILMHVTGNRDDAMLYYRKANQLAQQRFDTLNQVYTEANIGFLFLQENKLDSAQLFMDRVFTKPFSNQRYYFYLFYIGGSVSLQAGQFELARDLFLKGIDNSIKYNITPETGLAINFLGLSKAYQQLNNRDSSYYYGIKSIGLFKKVREVRAMDLDLASAYENMYEHFQRFGQRDSAYLYLELASKERNAFTKKTISNLAAFQKVLLKNQLLLKDLQREKVEAQGKARMYILLTVLTVFVLLGAVLSYGFFQKKKANELLAAQKEEILSTLSKLKSTQAQLIQKEKLASLGELTAGIAHEIQNPLNFVNNFSELSVELVEELQEALRQRGIERFDDSTTSLEGELLSDLIQNQQKINLHGKRAASIVKGMLEHSRMSTGERTLTDINKLADEYLRLAYHGLRAKDNTFNADYELMIDENLPNIEVIPQDIGRVLLNLINNAFWAVKTVEKPLVTVKTEQSNNQLIIKVIDNGTGMTEDVKAKIFQPFFTTKPTGEGTGLGLSLAYDIVTKGHGGTIEVESVEGEGTTFTIKLPIQNG